MTSGPSLCEILNTHSQTMRAIAANLRNIRSACRETCPQAVAPWSRAITVLEDEGAALFASSLDQNIIETQARYNACAAIGTNNAKHSRV